MATDGQRSAFGAGEARIATPLPLLAPSTPSALQPPPLVAARLARALELLGDLLPGHVVEELLLGAEGGPGPGPEEGGAGHGRHHQQHLTDPNSADHVGTLHASDMGEDGPGDEDARSLLVLEAHGEQQLGQQLLEQQQQAAAQWQWQWAAAAEESQLERQGGGGDRGDLDEQRRQQQPEDGGGGAGSCSSPGSTGDLWRLLEDGGAQQHHCQPAEEQGEQEEREQQSPWQRLLACEGPEPVGSVDADRKSCSGTATGGGPVSVCVSTSADSSAASTRASSRDGHGGGSGGSGGSAAGCEQPYSRSPSHSGCDLPCRPDPLLRCAALAVAPATAAAGAGPTSSARAVACEEPVELLQAAHAAEAVRLAAESVAVPSSTSSASVHATAAAAAAAVAAADAHGDLLASLSAPLPALRLPSTRRSGTSARMAPTPPPALCPPLTSSQEVACGPGAQDPQQQQQRASPVSAGGQSTTAAASCRLPRRPPLPRVHTMPVQRCTAEPAQQQQPAKAPATPTPRTQLHSRHRSDTDLAAALHSLDRSPQQTQDRTIAAANRSGSSHGCGGGGASGSGEATGHGAAVRPVGATIARSQSTAAVGSRAVAWLRSRSASASASMLAAAAAAAAAAVAAPFTGAVAASLTGTAAAAAAPETANVEDSGDKPAEGGGNVVAGNGPPTQQQAQPDLLPPRCASSGAAPAPAPAAAAAAGLWTSSGTGAGYGCAVNSPRASRRLHRASTGCFSVSAAGIYGGAYGGGGSTYGGGGGGADASTAFDLPANALGAAAALGCATTGAGGGAGGGCMWRAQRAVLTEAGEEGAGAASAAALMAARASVPLPLLPPLTGGGGGGWGGGGVTSAFMGGSGGRDLPYAEWHPCVSVLFADLVGFTAISNKVPPVAVMEMLNALYCRLDALCNAWGQQHTQPPGSPLPGSGAAAACLSPGAAAAATAAPPCPPGSVYKVQIIGDAYMVATGLLTDDPAHAATACMFALAVLREAEQVLDPVDGLPLRLRIGIHSGPVVSGVVGRLRRQYSVFGDTVNVASRMESTGAPGVIHVSEDTQRLAAPHMPPGCGSWRRREGVEVKGKGTMDTYWLLPQLAHAEAAASDCGGMVVEEPGLLDQHQHAV
ncbi:hypothetical protein HXX76_012540 [Chlamydomonas incerta]|uniref:Guanylate cyclase domain-containing protein n=1 Tax=Chlamydomonas incerta TaxID=51695 RepID=A0A835VW56_CHLIN|nr:hypothetical protein HXX76_012540 [Chlamydomonas incerta]|eukprot:KAG2427346.1 hypothetical protein HXX76_012540 [Chlamydomonas incerta]